MNQQIFKKSNTSTNDHIRRNIYISFCSILVLIFLCFLGLSFLKVRQVAHKAITKAYI